MMRLFVLQIDFVINKQAVHAGASVFIKWHNTEQVLSLGKYATVFQAEVKANMLGQPGST